MNERRHVIRICFWLGCLLLLLSCSDKVKVYPNVYEVPDSVSAVIKHPGMLHLDADFAFVKQKLAAGQAPWKNAFEHLTKSQYAQPSWTAHPVKLLARLDYNNWHDKYPDDYSNYINLMRDAAVAYQLALRWKLSGDDQYAKAAVQILNAWASTCTGYIVNSSGDFIDPNEYLISIQVYQLANAAEILRTSDQWAKSDFDKYKTWMVDVFYPHLTKFLSFHSNQTACPLHYWLNWDLATMTGILSIGILNDNQAMVTEVVKYFKNGVGSGNIKNAVPFVFPDPDSDEQLGQCQESGRDQGHATLCVSLMGVLCQMAKNIGIDLFTYDNNRALAMCEYVGKYNFGKTETQIGGGGGWVMRDFAFGVSSLPYTNYTNCTGNEWPSISFEEHKNGNDSRGTVRPAWELIDRLASDYGLSDIYTRKWVAKMRENTARGGSDGGAGDYGPNSGGFDQLGYGTLMFAK